MVADRVFLEAGHGLRGGSSSEERGCDFVHFFVSALGAEQNGDQQRERVAVVKGDRWFWVGLVQPLEDVVGPLSLSQGLRATTGADPRATGRLRDFV